MQRLPVWHSPFKLAVLLSVLSMLLARGGPLGVQISASILGGLIAA